MLAHLDRLLRAMKSACCALALWSCAPAVAPAPMTAPPTIVLRHDTPDERATAAQIRRLYASYDLAPWSFTGTLAIDAEATPHSHPVLTLHTRHLHDDLLLLSTLIHEQSHWYLTQHQPDVDAAVAELEILVPDLPVGFPDGAETVASTYEHLMVIALEERGVKRLAGELAAHEAMEFWATDHYRVIYRTVMVRRADVWRVMHAHHLDEPRAPPGPS